MQCVVVTVSVYLLTYFFIHIKLKKIIMIQGSRIKIINNKHV